MTHNHGIERNLSAYLQNDHSANHEYASKLSLLTPREMEIFAFLLAGLGNQEIAEKLCVTIKTVKNHLTTIYSKLCVKSRTEAIVEYYKTVQAPKIGKTPLTGEMGGIEKSVSRRIWRDRSS